jgi:RHH-type transcriptional regulator, proline utilization regulon repressor / proline dehydrogenase / delta 1-pyrroline-5-carboxylate dehydrogenase
MLKSFPFSEFAPTPSVRTPQRKAITRATRIAEAEAVAPLLDAAELDAATEAEVRKTAARLVERIRERGSRNSVEALIQEYSLSSEEGVALMCLAESLLRIPDDDTRDDLIRDKISRGAWSSHLGAGRSVFVNAATWGLIVTGHLTNSIDDRGLAAALTRLVARAGEPVVRHAVDLAMRMMGEQFVTGQTIAKALARAKTLEAKGFSYSYDMLGEAATCAADAERYFADYENAINAIGKASNGRGIYAGPGISIKLSAIHPRYSRAQAGRVLDELLPRLQTLAKLARSYDIGFNIDAEEADRLEISLELLEALALDPELAGWNGLGFVIQAYGKRCPMVIDWVIDLARRADRRIMIRLVKGAYWDAEIKRAQVDGLEDFPVYTRKLHTDVCYIACAKKLLAAPDAIFPQFATHNARTLATIYHLAGPDFELGKYEFQCLHGMGEALYGEVVGKDKLNRPCRVYAPVGTHDTLLAYLVRRLLENGANSSFVNRIADRSVPIDDLIGDPVAEVRAMPDPGAPHPAIDLPRAIYPDRRNSAGLDLANEDALAELTEALTASANRRWEARPTFGEGQGRTIASPCDRSDIVGEVFEVDAETAREAMRRAAGSDWGNLPVEQRTAMLERAADAMQDEMPTLMGIAMREAGKSAANAIAEVREAIDFMRYYAHQARSSLGNSHAPLGPIVCISPWNFPLAIFTGQVCAALAAGNTVVAKPAEETPLIAAQAVRILHEAGVPEDALQLMPGAGETGAALVSAPEAVAVMFTGSGEVAHLIQRQLSSRLSSAGKPIPLIAETGGINAMIVDSSALPEQVVADVMTSAFDSAGQRCSALRILCLQEDVADRMLTMLKGAMNEFAVGPTDRLRNDIGPVISEEARDGIESYIEAMRKKGHKVHRLELGPETEGGVFVAPTIIEVGSVEEVEREVFGPVLHVLRFRRGRRDALIDAINAMGYGLTFGLHTRLDETIAHVTARISAGNLYVNRNQVGAIVGVQPFGGHGLSGTGPKAGGPLYIGRLVANPPSIHIRGQMTAPALVRFAEWLDEQGHDEAAMLTMRYGELSALGAETRLAGPVGERNIYQLRPRGILLLGARNPKDLLEQMAVTLATGNRGHLLRMAVPNGLPADVTEAFSGNASGPFAAALSGAAADEVRAMLEHVAALDGPIATVHAAEPEEPCAYHCDWLLEEVAISVNTTAAGGNASLMTIE